MWPVVDTEVPRNTVPCHTWETNGHKLATCIYIHDWWVCNSYNYSMWISWCQTFHSRNGADVISSKDGIFQCHRLCGMGEYFWHMAAWQWMFNRSQIDGYDGYDHTARQISLCQEWNQSAGWRTAETSNDDFATFSPRFVCSLAAAPLTFFWFPWQSRSLEAQVVKICQGSASELASLLSGQEIDSSWATRLCLQICLDLRAVLCRTFVELSIRLLAVWPNSQGGLKWRAVSNHQHGDSDSWRSGASAQSCCNMLQ